MILVAFDMAEVGPVHSAELLRPSVGVDHIAVVRHHRMPESKAHATGLAVPPRLGDRSSNAWSGKLQEAQGRHGIRIDAVVRPLGRNFDPVPGQFCRKFEHILIKRERAAILSTSIAGCKSATNARTRLQRAVSARARSHPTMMSMSPVPGVPIDSRTSTLAMIGSETPSETRRQLPAAM